MGFKDQKVKKFALLGMGGALAMAIGDVILLGQPVSGSYYGLASFGAMEHIGALRASLGSLLGLIASTFTFFGYWYLKTLFEPVNHRQSIILFIALCSTMFFGGAFHAGYYFLSPAVSGTLPLAAHEKFIYHLVIISSLSAPGLMVGNFLFIKLSSDARFPKWLRFCNPMALNVFYLGVFYFIPAPVGGYLKPTFVNMATASLFTICALVKRK